MGARGTPFSLSSMGNALDFIRVLFVLSFFPHFRSFAFIPGQFSSIGTGYAALISSFLSFRLRIVQSLR
jgi:hypothetical protein